MKNIKAKVMKTGGETGKFASKFCSIVDDVNIDDIVVVKNNFGLSFAVVTDVEEGTADISRHKALCVVPNEENVIF